MGNAQAGTARTGAAAPYLTMILGAVLVAALAGAAVGALIVAPRDAGTEQVVAAQTVDDSSYDQVEQLRGTRTLPGVGIDTSYDRRRELRAARPGG